MAVGDWRQATGAGGVCLPVPRLRVRVPGCGQPPGQAPRRPRPMRMKDTEPPEIGTHPSCARLVTERCRTARTALCLPPTAGSVHPGRAHAPCIVNRPRSAFMVPFFGWAGVATGHIAINRTHKSRAIAALNSAVYAKPPAVPPAMSLPCECAAGKNRVGWGWVGHGSLWPCVQRARACVCARARSRPCDLGCSSEPGASGAARRRVCRGQLFTTAMRQRWPPVLFWVAVRRTAQARRDAAVGALRGRVAGGAPCVHPLSAPPFQH